jgi:hypothetical protein
MRKPVYKVSVLKSSKVYPEFFKQENLFVFGDLMGDCGRGF